MAGAIRMVLFDSDGVLTDGGVWIDEEGRQTRRFDIKDGAGIARLVRTGIPVGVVSASEVPVVRHRMAGLGVAEIHLGVEDKEAAVDEILRRHGVGWEQLAFMGDDQADLAVLRKAGFGAAPADAVAEVLDCATWISRHNGGFGAVRELCDHLFAEGFFEDVV